MTEDRIFGPELEGAPQSVTRRELDNTLDAIRRLDPSAMQLTNGALFDGLSNAGLDPSAAESWARDVVNGENAPIARGVVRAVLIAFVAGHQLDILRQNER
jgi:hypothetical protein